MISTPTTTAEPAPTTDSTPLSEIVVDSYGPGGIATPSGWTGSFDGQTGWVPDEWVDTKWDAKTLPQC